MSSKFMTTDANPRASRVGPSEKFVVCGLGALLPTIGAMIAGWRAAPVRVKSFDQSRGVVRLWFRNENYLNDIVANQ
jgi:hypothetical protein